MSNIYSDSKTVLVISIFLFFSCTSDRSGETKRADTSRSEVTTNKDFKIFWSNFGQALSSNDTVALEKYLDSSVSIHGREDDDPKFELTGRQRILKVRDIYLNGGIYDYQKDVNISYAVFFKDKNALDHEYVENQSSQSIEDFTFTRASSDEWRLTDVYTNTKDFHD